MVYETMGMKRNFHASRYWKGDIPLSLVKNQKTCQGGNAIEKQKNFSNDPDGSNGVDNSDWMCKAC